MLPFELTKDTPYLALSGELWSVFCEYFNRNWPCYKGFLLYWFHYVCPSIRRACRICAGDQWIPLTKGQWCPKPIHVMTSCNFPLPSGNFVAYSNTVETLYSTIYYSQNFIELNIDKSTQYVALWTHKRHPIPRPFGRAMECLLWVLQQKLIVL